jgi:hypothetical protein
VVPGRGAAPGAYLGAAGNRPPLRLGHGQGAGHIPRSPHKVRLVPRAPLPAAARGRGVPNVAGRPPGLRSVHPPPPAPARPLVLKAPRPGLRHRSVAPRLRPPRCGCCAPLRLAPSLPPLGGQPHRASRSRRFRARQGIRPVKTLAGGDAEGAARGGWDQTASALRLAQRGYSGISNPEEWGNIGFRPARNAP